MGSSGRFQALHQAVAMAVWIRSGRVRFRHVSSRPLLAGLATAAWARVDSGLCEGTRHIYMQAGVSLVSTFFLVLVPSASQGESSSLASDLGSGQQTWHNVRSGAGAGPRALGTTTTPQEFGCLSCRQWAPWAGCSAPHGSTRWHVGGMAGRPAGAHGPRGANKGFGCVHKEARGRHLLLLAPTDRCPTSCQMT